MVRADRRSTAPRTQHHSFLVDSLLSLEEVRANFEATYHVTGVEESQCLTIV